MTTRRRLLPTLQRFWIFAVIFTLSQWIVLATSTPGAGRSTQRQHHQVTLPPPARPQNPAQELSRTRSKADVRTGSDRPPDSPQPQPNQRSDTSMSRSQAHVGPSDRSASNGSPPPVTAQLSVSQARTAKQQPKQQHLDAGAGPSQPQASPPQPIAPRAGSRSPANMPQPPSPASSTSSSSGFGPHAGPLPVRARSEPLALAGSLMQPPSPATPPKHSITPQSHTPSPHGSPQSPGPHVLPPVRPRSTSSQHSTGLSNHEPPSLPERRRPSAASKLVDPAKPTQFWVHTGHVPPPLPTSIVRTSLAKTKGVLRKALGRSHLSPASTLSSPKPADRRSDLSAKRSDDWKFVHPVTGARYSLPSGHPNPNPGAVFRTRGGSWFYRDGRLAQDLKWGLKRPGSTAEAARQGPLVFSEEVRKQELKYRAERRARGERDVSSGYSKR